MGTSIGYERPKYTDYEISFMLRTKVSQCGLSIENIAANYQVSIEYIKVMLNGKNHFSRRMLDIAAQILEIDYDELVAIDIDSSEVSCRQATSEDKSDFFDMLNYIFGEIILQRKMSIE